MILRVAAVQGLKTVPAQQRQSIAHRHPHLFPPRAGLNTCRCIGKNLGSPRELPVTHLLAALSLVQIADFCAEEKLC